MQQVLLTVLLLFFLSSCSDDSDQNEVTDSLPASSASSALSQKGCKSCHSMTLDAAHDFDCIVCHNGTAESADIEISHENLIARPAHPDTMEQVCGQCHLEQVQNTTHSLHFTVKHEVNRIRTAFGAQEEIASLVDIPIHDFLETPLHLADDLLRRSCLRCHPYSSGDRYPAIARGTGCASCHLEFYEGKLVSHSFLKTPGDSQCLQCHYGNRVGYDYYGRYEHDMNDEYRTPYTTRQNYFRPFGIEFHQLSSDIHQQHGLVCVDCHGAKELMAENATKISCSDCHDKKKMGQKIPLSNISQTTDGNTYTLLSAGDGKKHTIPFMKHPAHAEYNGIANCQVCHAQWSFDDRGTHLLRSDLEEYDDFSRLTVQGSFEVEQILKNNLDFDVDEIPHVMTDKITGEARNGLWYKGYETRRWENITIGRDSKGRLQVMRPLLNMYLSWVDVEGDIQFDSVQANAENNGFVPYIPHTTGKAGLFYKERITEFLKSEHSAVE